MNSRTPPPFARHEWLIAWRYLRARRAEGGVSVMTVISLVGIALAVAALIITLSVRAGFRAEFVDAILGANAHATVYPLAQADEAGRVQRALGDHEAMAAALRRVPGVIRVAPLVRGQAMASVAGRNAFVEVHGIAPADLAAIPRVAEPQLARGALSDVGGVKIALGWEVARSLNVGVGDTIRLISPEGVRTAFGTSPRVKAYEVAYVFQSGRYAVDRSRLYMAFTEAQAYFNRGGAADELEVMLSDPERVEAMTGALMAAAGAGTLIWTWRDAQGAFLRALDVEDTVMFVLMSVLVLIAALNIISGLVMLVKNKGRDIGILRTIGLTQGAVMRVFFLCGAMTGLVGTLLGVVAGCLFALYFDQILAFVNGASGGGVWDASVRGIYRLPADLRGVDIAKAVGLSLSLSFLVTLLPARRAARMNPVEALRYE